MSTLSTLSQLERVENPELLPSTNSANSLNKSPVSFSGGKGRNWLHGNRYNIGWKMANNFYNNTNGENK